MRPQPEPEPSGEEGQPPVEEEQVTVEVADEDSPLLDAEPTHTRAAVSPAAGKVQVALFLIAAIFFLCAYWAKNDEGATAGTWVLFGFGMLFLLLLIGVRVKLLSACARSKAEGPLAGIKVLDISVVVAAPYAAALLGELGAEVSAAACFLR